MCFKYKYKLKSGLLKYGFNNRFHELVENMLPQTGQFAQEKQRTGAQIQ